MEPWWQQFLLIFLKTNVIFCTKTSLISYGGCNSSQIGARRPSRTLSPGAVATIARQKSAPMGQGILFRHHGATLRHRLVTEESQQSDICTEVDVSLRSRRRDSRHCVSGVVLFPPPRTHMLAYVLVTSITVREKKKRAISRICFAASEDTRGLRDRPWINARRSAAIFRSTD